MLTYDDRLSYGSAALFSLFVFFDAGGFKVASDPHQSLGGLLLVVGLVFVVWTMLTKAVLFICNKADAVLENWQGAEYFETVKPDTTAGTTEKAEAAARAAGAAKADKRLATFLTIAAANLAIFTADTDLHGFPSWEVPERSWSANVWGFFCYVLFYPAIALIILANLRVEFPVFDKLVESHPLLIHLVPYVVYLLVVWSKAYAKEFVIDPCQMTYGAARAETEILKFPDFAYSSEAGKIPVGGKPVVENSAEITLRGYDYTGKKPLVTIAPTGTGKGACVQVPTLCQHRASMLIIDPKGENAVITARHRRDVLGHQVHIVNPFGVLADDFQKRGFRSSGFNPLAVLDVTSPNFVADVGGLAEALIITQGKDPYFDDTARELVAALIMWVCIAPGEAATLPRVRELLCNPALPDMMKELAKSPYKPLANKAGGFVVTHGGLDSVIQSAKTQTAFLDDPCLAENLSRDDFRFLLMKRRNITVYLVLPFERVVTYARWLRLFVVSGFNALVSTHEQRQDPVLFMLDEFQNLGRLSCVETAFSGGRGFGVQVWPFIQDMSKVTEIYGKAAESMLSNAGLVQYFTPGRDDLQTAKRIAERCGQTTIVTETRGTGTSEQAGQGGRENTSLGWSEKPKPLFKPEEIAALPKTVQILFAEGCKNPLVTARVPYYEIARLRGWQVDENPYYAASCA